MASSTTVKVGVRVRPLTAKEQLSSCSDCTTVIPGANTLLIGDKTFSFDHIFDSCSLQAYVYDTCVSPLLDKFLEGFHATILAYGQTGSGKTYSMGTGLDGNLNSDQQGIVPRAIHTLFDVLNSRKQANPEGFKYQVYVSFLELYNEELIDLLNPSPQKSSNANSNSGNSGDRPRTAQAAVERGWNGLTIREDGQGGIVWMGVKEEECKTPEELFAFLQKGSLCRTTGATDMNVSSSRSHAIFSVTLKQQSLTPNTPSDENAGLGSTESIDGKPVEGTPLEGTDKISSSATNLTSTDNGSWQRLVSKFHFVDLAGSERLKRTNAVGDRAKEGISINQGLLALGNVISALADDAKYVPYRDSKLTRLLQDSLGGNSQTLMLACVSPSDSNYQETVNTLRYADRAKNIKNRAVINADWVNGVSVKEMERQIKDLRNLVGSLRSELANVRGSAGIDGSSTSLAMVSSGSFTGDSASGLGSRALSSSYLNTRGMLLYQEQQQQLELTQQKAVAAHMELEKMKKESHQLNFETERLKFANSQLRERVKKMNREMMVACSQRDSLMIAKSPNGEEQENTDNNTTTSVPAANVEAHPIVMGYAQTIAKLKLKLADTEDKLAWYNEIMYRVSGVNMAQNHADETKRKQQQQRRRVSKSRRLSGGEGDGGDGSDGGEEYDDEEYDNDVADNGTISKKKRISKGESVGDEDDMSDFYDSDLEDNADAVDGELDGEEKRVSVLSDGDDDDNNDDDNEDEELVRREAEQEELYKMLHKIQNDITMKEDLVGQLEKSQQEYSVMREKYEQKLKLLHENLQAVQYERDLALKRMKNPNDKNDPAQAKLKIKYEERTKKLTKEIDELKRKFMETSKAMSANRTQNENLIKNMRQNIDSLKTEKGRLVRQLKTESDKLKQIKSQNEREIEKLRRKEKATAELAKRLEKNNQLQKLLLQRRTEQMLTSHKQLKQLKSVMNILKKSNTPKSISKGSMNNLASPMNKRNNRHLSRTSSSSSSPRNLSRSNSHNSIAESQSHLLPPAPTPSSDVRSSFKKKMLEKEVDQVVAGMQLKGSLDGLVLKKTRLNGEQRELLAERERVVAATAEETGVYDPDSPQYMDDRLELIEEEVRLLDNRIEEIKDQLSSIGYANVIDKQLNMSANDGSKSSNNVQGLLSGTVNFNDFGFENAANLLKSLDVFEMEKVSEMFLQDIVALKMTDRMNVVNVSTLEKTVDELRKTLQVMKKTAVNATKEYEKRVKVLEEKLSEAERQRSKSSSVVNRTTSPIPVLAGVSRPSTANASLGSDPSSSSTAQEPDMEYVLASDRLLQSPSKRGVRWVKGGEIFNRIYQTGVGLKNALTPGGSQKQTSNGEISVSATEGPVSPIRTSSSNTGVVENGSTVLVSKANIINRASLSPVKMTSVTNLFSGMLAASSGNTRQQNDSRSQTENPFVASGKQASTTSTTRRKISGAGQQESSNLVTSVSKQSLLQTHAERHACAFCIAKRERQVQDSVDTLPTSSMENGLDDTNECTCGGGYSETCPITGELLPPLGSHNYPAGKQPPGYSSRLVSVNSKDVFERLASAHTLASQAKMKTTSMVPSASTMSMSEHLSPNNPPKATSPVPPFQASNGVTSFGGVDAAE